MVSKRLKLKKVLSINLLSGTLKRSHHPALCFGLELLQQTLTLLNYPQVVLPTF